MKKKRSFPIVGLIISIVGAFLLWLYVMSVESPISKQTFYGVSVELQNENVLSQNGFSVLSGYGNTIDISVTGRKSLINQLDSSDFKAYVDLNNINEAGDYPLNITVILKEGLTLDSMSQNTITVYIDVTTSKTVRIDDQISYLGGVTAGTAYSMGEPYIMPTAQMPDTSSVVVKGPVSILNSISMAKVDTINLGTITSSVTYNQSISFYDSADNVITSQYVTPAVRAVMVYFPVVTEKEVKLEPNFISKFDSSAYSYSVVPSIVRIRGEESTLRNIDSVKFDVEGTDASLVGTNSYDVAIEGIEIADGTSVCRLTVKKIETTSSTEKAGS